MRADEHLWEVMKGTSSSLIIQVVGSILGFAVSIAVARMFGAEGSGVYYLALSMATIAATVGRVGFDNTVVRFVASHASVQEWGAVRQVYGTAMKVVAAASLFISVGLCFGAEWIANALFDKPYMELPLRLVAMSVLPLSFAMIHAEGLRGLKCIPASQWIKTVLTSLGTLLFLYPLAQLWGANGVVAAYVAATIATAVAAWLIWQRAWKNRCGISFDPQNGFLKQGVLFRSSWPLFGVALTGLVVQQAGTVFLGVLGGVGDVGVFSVANRIANLLLFPLMAMISIIAPKFAAMYRQGDMDGLKQLSRSSSRILTILTVPVAFFVAICAEWIMALFGADFKYGVSALYILLFGVVVNVVTGPVGNILMMTGHEYIVRNVMVLTSLVVIILCIILIPVTGANGAAIALAVGSCLQNIYMTVQVRRHFGYWPISFSKLMV